MEKVHIREKYLEKIKPYIGKNIIKVLTGQRRVGKTSLLKQIIDFIENEDSDTNPIYINKKLNTFKQIKTADDLFEYVTLKSKKGKVNYVFIDEVQEIENFEIAIRQLFAESYDIFCTGSNAKMLSSDLATHLSQRYIEFKINSLSYKEFMQFHKLQNNNDTLSKYIRYGGLPYLIHLPFDDEIVYGYLKSIYNTIILKIL